MEVSKLSISQETIGRLNAMAYVSPKRKRQIRIEGIEKLIRSKHSGYKFRLLDLIQAAGYRTTNSNGKQYWAGAAFVASLIKKGVILKNADGKVHLSSYSIPSDVKIKTSKKEVKLIDKIVERNIEDIVSNESEIEALAELKAKEYAKATNAVNYVLAEEAIEAGAFDDEESTYSFEIRIQKKKDDGEYGKSTVANLEICDTTLTKTQHMITELIKNIR